MPKRKIASVFVFKEWFDESLRYVVGQGRSNSTGEAHLVTAPLENAADPNGLWLKGLTTTQLGTGSEPTELEILIPWRYVMAVAVYDSGDDSSQPTVGFKGPDATVLK